MPRLPWDELSNSPIKEVKPQTPPEEFKFLEDKEPPARDVMGDINRISKRILFGFVAGGFTGTTFGFVEVLRDPKAFSVKKSVVSAKILRYSTLFGGFFGSYHGTRMALKLYFPQPKEENIMTAAVLTVAPLIAYAPWRAVIPYALVMVGLDAYTELAE